MIFQTQILWSNIIHSLIYLRSATLGCKDIGILKDSIHLFWIKFHKWIFRLFPYTPVSMRIRLVNYGRHLHHTSSPLLLNIGESKHSKLDLKGVFVKNERGYRLTAKTKRLWSLLILLLSVASIRRKLLKTTHIEERNVNTNSQSCNIQLGS